MKLMQIPRSKEGCDYCAVCHQPYIKHPGHLYKVRSLGKTYSECSYNCWIKAKAISEGKE